MQRCFRINWIHILCSLVIGYLSYVPLARAELQIDITKGVTRPMPIAIIKFDGVTEEEQAIAQTINDVVSANLVNCGLFRKVDEAAYIQTSKQIDRAPNYNAWTVIGAEALVAGSVKAEKNRITVEFRLWDLLGKKRIEGQILTGQNNIARRIGHKISDFIYHRITGEAGYFDSQIVYVTEYGPFNRRIKQIAIMDQDGANNRILTDPRVLTLTPRFSPHDRTITYMSYFNNRPRVFIFDLQTGKQETVGDFPGMTFAPRFAPDGSKVIMSLARDGHSDIFSLELQTRLARQLPKKSSGAIDTSPSYAPDGARIVFNSDRGGSQQLYTMNSDGTSVKRISFGQGIYATPVWSPRGDLIAFTKIYSGRFHIGVMRPDGSGERLLTDSFLDEGPTWSPNGRVLMFFRQSPTDKNGLGASSKLMTIDVTGTIVREYRLPQDASDPAWSPLIQ